MGLTYGSADGVFVWLEKDETDLEHMNWAINNLLPKIKEEPLKFINTGLLMDTQRMTKEDVSILEREMAGAMRFVSTRRWFSRAWVVQEVALSKHIQVLCGRTVFSWEDLTALHRVLGITDWGRILVKKLGIEDQRQAYFIARNAIEKFQDIRAYLEAYGLPLDRKASTMPTPGKIHPVVVYGGETELEKTAAWLAYLLIFVRGQDCAFEQDKIYSVLGIADRFSNNIDEIVCPNYSLSAPKVYEATTAQLILHSRFLSVLGHAVDLRLQVAAGLPSWVADYSKDSELTPLTYSGASKEYLFDSSESRSSARFPRSVENSRLCLVEAPFDEVTHALTPDMGEVLSGNGQVEEFVAFGGSLPLRYFNGQNPVDVLWRTIIFDAGQSDDDRSWSSPAPQTYRQSFRAWWITQGSKWLALHADEDGVWAPAPAIRFLCQLFDPDTISTLQTNDFKLAMIHLLVTQTTLKGDDDAFDQYFKEILPFSQAYSTKSDGRRLFKTQCHFVRMGPLSVQPSDQIWPIRDSLVPLVLRPVKDTDTFLLVGEAYLHGFTYGEMCWNYSYCGPVECFRAY